MTFSSMEIADEYYKEIKKVRAGKGGCVTQSMIDKQRGFHAPTEFAEVKRLGNFVLRKPIKIMAKRIRKLQQ